MYKVPEWLLKEIKDYLKEHLEIIDTFHDQIPKKTNRLSELIKILEKDYNIE